MRRRRLLSALAAVLLALGCLRGSPAAEPKRLIEAEDLAVMRFISSVEVSNDGAHVAFVVTQIDPARDGYDSNVWVVASDGSHIEQLTRGDHDADPQWSPDGATIAFVRVVAGHPQVFRIAFDGGEALQLTRSEQGATRPRWSHDGKHILYSVLAIDEREAAHVDWKRAGVMPKDDQRQTDVRTIDGVHFAFNGLGFIYDHHIHLWKMNAEGGDAAPLTEGSAWSENNAEWSPDDSAIVFTSLRHRTAEIGLQNVYVIPSSGGIMRPIPSAFRSQMQPHWSHDGKHVWFFGRSADDPSATAALVESDIGGDDVHVAVKENTLAFGNALANDAFPPAKECAQVLGDDHEFLTGASTPGASALVAVDVQTGHLRSIANGGNISDCSASADGTVVGYVADDATHLPEVYVVRGSLAPKRVTALNDRLASTAAFVQPEAHVAKNSSNEDVPYWIMRPPHGAADEKRPTVLEIHGGPRLEFGNAFVHEFQVIAASGYNVVYANPRGSAGYGYAWSSAIDGNWGVPLQDDEMAVLDAIEKLPGVDPARCAVVGGSYGGYAALWLVGHTNRFKAAIAERAISNLTSQQLGADYAGPVSTAHKWGAPWVFHEKYWSQSPIAYAHHIRTPLLLLHGDDDLRTPVDQTYQMYFALQLAGSPVALVEFPRENHDLSRKGEPLHRIERLHIIESWLKAHL